MSEDPLLESRLVVDQHMTEVEITPFADGEVAVFSTSRPSSIGPNQDSAGLLPCGPNAGVLVVADGVGGHPSGAKASALAIEHLRLTVTDAAATGASSIREAILDGIEKGNRAILELGVGAATTLAVVEIQGSEMRTYHVGDSTILAVGQRKKQKLLTVSHSPVGYAVEAGVLDPRDALHHEDLALVSNLVGSAEMRIEIGPHVQLADRDTVVIGSDGLFDNLHIEEVMELVRKGPIAAAANELLRACVNRMRDPEEGEPSKSDDLTFIIYRPKRSPSKARGP